MDWIFHHGVCACYMLLLHSLSFLGQSVVFVAVLLKCTISHLTTGGSRIFLEELGKVVLDFSSSRECRWRFLSCCAAAVVIVCGDFTKWSPEVFLLDRMMVLFILSGECGFAGGIFGTHDDNVSRGGAHLVDSQRVRPSFTRKICLLVVSLSSCSLFSLPSPWEGA
ncbi:hypothetical protein BV898_13156 [Hypsibius exemplaris]|uniref:Uncharacterized protein n=1 Tax=Hypsibius exemplaris TaxID=2072580 RepID=A0A1W0WBK6_HYPEX|nr:hypothetical protein BV898_13156 [Hypsibius exemplaris]